MARAAQRSKRSYHHGDLRRALVEAALGLLGKRDATSLSLRDVARRAGVSAAAPYHHFRSKDALLAAVAMEGYRVLEQQVAAAMAQAHDPLGRLRALGEAYVRFGLSHPSHYRVMFRPEIGAAEAEPELIAVTGQAFEQLVELVRQAQAKGTGEARTHAIAIWSALHGLVSLWNEGPLRRKVDAASIEPLSRQIADRLTRMLSVEPPRRGAALRRARAAAE